ncbi:MAG: hypothetical protein AAGF12_03360 [Myxococcota bacterium]
MARLLVLLSFVVACGEATTAPAVKLLGPEPVEARDQYALLAAIDAVRAQGSVDEEVSPVDPYARVRRDWEDQRYRWEAMFVPATCLTPSNCMVMPFDHHRADTSGHGFLPRLQLTSAEAEVLRQRCEAVGPGCVFRFTGTLERLQVSDELPTSLSFTQIEIGDARPARSDESWIRRPRG